MKVRINSAWKDLFKKGEIVNGNEFADKVLDYYCKTGTITKLGAKDKRPETAEKKPRAERAVTRGKPEPGKPQPPKDADKKDADKKE